MDQKNFRPLIINYWMIKMYLFGAIWKEKLISEKSWLLINKLTVVALIHNKLSLYFILISASN
jgi:hypothetical protein